MNSYSSSAIWQMLSCKALGRLLRDVNCRMLSIKGRKGRHFECTVRQLLASGCHFTSEAKQKNESKSLVQFLRDKKIVPDSEPPSTSEINLLHQLFDRSRKLMVLTGAGLSTESGIPDYRSPHGAYSSGFKPITHQEFVRSSRARRRYWTRSYAGWRRFISAQPSAGHMSLAALQKVGWVNFMVTQNVDSDPLELHGTVYTVVCLNCGTSIGRNAFQDQVKALNTKWAAAVESLEHGDPGSNMKFGMQQRPDGDIEVDEKFWEQDFVIPDCHQCGGMLKPDVKVVFFGDNVPKDRAEKAMDAAKSCDAFLVLGSSLMAMSAFRLVRAAHEAKADVAIVNIGETRADDFVPLKINARVGQEQTGIYSRPSRKQMPAQKSQGDQILPRVLQIGCLNIPCIS